MSSRVHRTIAGALGGVLEGLPCRRSLQAGAAFSAC